MEIIKQKYLDFGPTLANEKLKEIHNINLSTESLRQLMIKEKLWTAKPVRAEAYPHTWRARKDSFGEMEQYDGSYDDWFEGRLKVPDGKASEEQCLLASIDDASGKLTGLRFAESEGVIPTLEFWEIYMKTHGKPLSIYLDRFSTYKNNPKKNTAETLDLTQFERAMNQLSIRVIHAHSPQGKGRVERLFQTLQDRLIKELRLRSISTIAEANEFLTKTFVPEFNNKFAVTPKSAVNSHRALSQEEKLNLETICSIQEQRTVMNDYTISHEALLYQIEPRQKTLVRVGDRVIVCIKLDGSKAILKHGKELEFTEITQRAQKVHTAPRTIDGRTHGHKPQANHPWRQTFIIKTKEKQLA